MNTHSDDRSELLKNRELTDLLLGALADGVDLGPRGNQIRTIGMKLEEQLQDLEKALSNIEIGPASDSIAASIKQIRKAARIAANYGIKQSQE